VFCRLEEDALRVTARDTRTSEVASWRLRMTPLRAVRRRTVVLACHRPRCSMPSATTYTD
jgi:hypothetical protein